MIPRTIVERYYLERAQAETADDKRRVWRTYARAVIEEFQRPERRVHVRTLGAPLIIWRRAHGDDHSWACPCGETIRYQASQPDDLECEECEEPLTEYTEGLPKREPRYWARLPLHDLQELWLALERARHRASDE
ncbi:hypothetical protein GCM10009095_20400 [Sphingomonas molluscorum]|uniref:hypothetical protein n=1 Tax=Sphingomonas sp. ABOLF TaxID=1985879 RepID=UPI0013DFD1DD|nr:hypothetical protein [Sphingomonas sp. ABOLF]GLK19212.1 hypothetical protein GCM10017606_00380 [Microbacterium terregens]